MGDLACSESTPFEDFPAQYVFASQTGWPLSRTFKRWL